MKGKRFTEEQIIRILQEAEAGLAVAELASHYDIHPNMIAMWKRQALAGMKEGSGRNAQKADNNREAEIKTLQAKIGELIVERDFLSKAFDR